MADHGQKTEKPSPKRVQKAREEGNFPVAKEFVSALQFFGVLLILSAYGAYWFNSVRNEFRHSLVRAFQPEFGLAEFFALLRGLTIEAFLPLGFAGAMLVALTLAVHLISTGFGVSTKRLLPNLKNFNPVARLKDLPKQNAASLAQAALLLAITAAVLYTIVRDNLGAFMLLPLSSVPAGTARVWESVESLLWKLAGVLMVFGAVDLFRKRMKWTRDLRMTKQEIKDEHKESEGNPQIKAQIRRIRRTMLRRQMMKDVATATAVIVNPTHYAIAIKYDMENMASPQVVAKGQNYLALRIRQRAIENAVPIVENPPLARALYKSVEVGGEIPANFYRAVAEVLAYVFKVMNQTRPIQTR